MLTQTFKRVNVQFQLKSTAGYSQISSTVKHKLIYPNSNSNPYQISPSINHHCKRNYHQKYNKYQLYSQYPTTTFRSSSLLHHQSKYRFTVTPLEDDGTLSLLQYGDKQIYLLGTAHISTKSAEQVRQVIQQIKPDTVFVELCPERAQRIWQKIRTNQENGQQGDMTPITTEEWMDDLPFAQKFKSMNIKVMKFLESFGFVYGGEFYAALEEGERINAKLVYGDRNVRETMQKLNDGLSAMWGHVSPNFSWKDIWSDFSDTYKKHSNELFTDVKDPQTNTNKSSKNTNWNSNNSDYYKKSDDGKTEFFGETANNQQSGGTWSWSDWLFGNQSQVEQQPKQKQQQQTGSDNEGFFNSWKKATEQSRKMNEELRNKSQSYKKKMPKGQWKEIWGLFTNPEETIEAMKDRKKIKAKLDSFKEIAPELCKGLIDERDEIMSNNLKNCDGKIIVAVVGIGHMDGMEAYFKNL